MTGSSEFGFGDDSVAGAYDRGLVPVLFEPWAERLVREHGPWRGLRVLDLATGTGIVAEKLAGQVGAEGRVVGADLNAEMLSLARRRCAGSEPPVEWVQSPAHPLDLRDACVDRVVCQQGFQFFPDKDAAAREIHRVLDREGRAVVVSWRPVSACGFFGAICQALEAMGESEIAALMRVPFDHLPEAALRAHFEAAGFGGVEVERAELDLVMPGGLASGVEMVFASPIGPRLRELPGERRASSSGGSASTSSRSATAAHCAAPRPRTCSRPTGPPDHRRPR